MSNTKYSCSNVSNSGTMCKNTYKQHNTKGLCAVHSKRLKSLHDPFFVQKTNIDRTLRKRVYYQENIQLEYFTTRRKPNILRRVQKLLNRSKNHELKKYQKHVLIQRLMGDLCPRLSHFRTDGTYFSMNVERFDWCLYDYLRTRQGSHQSTLEWKQFIIDIIYSLSQHRIMRHNLTLKSFVLNEKNKFDLKLIGFMKSSTTMQTRTNPIFLFIRMLTIFESRLNSNGSQIKWSMQKHIENEYKMLSYTKKQSLQKYVTSWSPEIRSVYERCTLQNRES